jgi:hypothetical protein
VGANSTGFSETKVVMHVNVPVPLITTRGLEQIGLGNEVSLQIHAYNEPSGFDAIGLPPELEIDRTTGHISGMALEPGAFEVQLIATNSFGTGTGALTLEVSPVVAWGDSSHGQTTVPRGLTHVVDLAAGQLHTLALLGHRQSTPPLGLHGGAAIAAGGNHSVALTGLPAGRIAPQWVGPRQLLGTADLSFHEHLAVLQPGHASRRQPPRDRHESTDDSSLTVDPFPDRRPEHTAARADQCGEPCGRLSTSPRAHR